MKHLLQFVILRAAITLGRLCYRVRWGEMATAAVLS